MEQKTLRQGTLGTMPVMVPSLMQKFGDQKLDKKAKHDGIEIRA